MKQRINLLPPRPKVQRDWLLAKNVGAGLVAVVVCCALMSGWLWYTLQNNNTALAGLSEKASEQQTHIEALETELAARKPDASLMNDRNALIQKIESKRYLTTLLALVQPGNQQGFSSAMRGFSQSVPEALWLTEFTLDATGGELQLSGSSAQADRVPVFLRQLVKQSAFHGVHFSELSTELSDNLYFFKTTGVQALGSQP